MSRSIRKETSSLAFGIVGRCGGISAGFKVTALNAASAASREVVVLRVLSADIFMTFRVLGYPPRGLRTEIFGGDMVATRTTSTKAALNGVRPKNILYSNA